MIMNGHYGAAEEVELSQWIPTACSAWPVTRDVGDKAFGRIAQLRRDQVGWLARPEKFFRATSKEVTSCEEEVLGRGFMALKLSPSTPRTSIARPRSPAESFESSVYSPGAVAIRTSTSNVRGSANRPLKALRIDRFPL